MDLSRELSKRGVDISLDDLQQSASLEAIEGAIHWFDKQRSVGPGLLVHRIRQGGVQELPPREKELLERFAAQAQRFPVGSALEPHARLQARRWPDDELCPGGMVAYEHAFPSIAAECDRCEFDAGYPLRVLETVL